SLQMNLISSLKIKIEQNSLQMNLISPLKIKIEQNSLQMNLISLLKIKIEKNSLQMNLISSLKKISQIILTSQFISDYGQRFLPPLPSFVPVFDKQFTI
ncbi:hypothetical protein ACFSC5_16130, partial [Oceanobacillus bengalensis]